MIRLLYIEHATPVISEEQAQDILQSSRRCLSGWSGLIFPELLPRVHWLRQTL